MKKELIQKTLSIQVTIATLLMGVHTTFAAGIADLTVKSLAHMLTNFFAQVLIPFGVTVLFLVFVFNVIKYIKADSSKGHSDAIGKLLFSVFGIFVISAFAAFVFFFRNILGVQ